MSRGTPGMPDGKPSSSSYAQQAQNNGSLYSFSVHQPYTNWPLHASHTTPYAPSWYTLPTQQQYGTQRTYCEREVQTLRPGEAGLSDDAVNGKGKGSGAGELEQKFAKQWDAALSAFLKRAGLVQALAGLREDMLMLNQEWERERIPDALQSFVDDISECMKNEDPALPKRPLEERKLDYVQAQESVEAQTPSSAIRSISNLLKQSRKRNDASNRAEFLQSTAEKRRRLNALGESPSSAPDKDPNNTLNPEVQESGANDKMDVDAPPSSCARADAKSQDRDFQVKYDIAKNEDGPLKRTMKREQVDNDSSGVLVSATPQSRMSMDRNGHEPTAEKHPGLSDRMETIEDHLGVRFVPSRPRSLQDRLKFLEDYVIRLEKDYPPWAALHFNQPNRGWPPPPRPNPIIIPSHLAAPDPFTRLDTASGQSSSFAATQGSPSGIPMGISPSTTISAAKPGNSKAKSSLHRAVMEKLEIRRAIGDLAGSGGNATVSSVGDGHGAQLG